MYEQIHTCFGAFFPAWTFFSLGSRDMTEKSCRYCPKKHIFWYSLDMTMRYWCAHTYMYIQTNARLFWRIFFLSRRIFFRQSRHDSAIKSRCKCLVHTLTCVQMCTRIHLQTVDVHTHTHTRTVHGLCIYIMPTEQWRK